tara:strand:- start:475 stop:1179 length:705 start_codon:yes stop_codon:yes gene_type:complete
VSKESNKLSKKIRFSLCCGRTYATHSNQLSKVLLSGWASDTNLKCVFVKGMSLLEQELFKHFPDNIFADFDMLFAHIIAKSKQYHSPGNYFLENCKFISKLFAIYGSNSSVRFQYIHDFLYGFDWARWVQKSPHSRRAVGPFDPVFLNHLFLRGNELHKLIKENNKKYPILNPNKMRNPFPFSRKPRDERILHDILAEKKLIPVNAWTTNGDFSHDQDYHNKRIEQAILMTKNH